MPIIPFHMNTYINNGYGLAREAAINEERIRLFKGFLRLFVKETVEVLRNSAYIVNTNNSISKAAIYAATVVPVYHKPLRRFITPTMSLLGFSLKPFLKRLASNEVKSNGNK
jgi:hypothetical protein